jgi:hypothetical protein
MIKVKGGKFERNREKEKKYGMNETKNLQN